MAFRAVAYRAKHWRLLGDHARRSALSWLRGGRLFHWRLSGRSNDQLVIAPQDLRTSDPTISAEFYGGHFSFAGKTVDTDGNSPFDISPPSRLWAVELHSFGWLRHMRAADTIVARANARALVEDWIRNCGRGHPVGWDKDVIARRVLAWLSQSPMVLDGCDQDFHRKFIRVLVRQVRYLRRTINDAQDGLPRMRMCIALMAACVSISGQARHFPQTSRRLDQEIERQILPDGGHISRNPAAILEILADLLPVRQAIIAQGQSPSQVVMNAIDRMTPMIRFFRHGDGAFAHFNGMSTTPTDLVATLLAYDDARGAPPNNAAHSAYQRLAAGHTVVIADVGAPPPVAVSREAHAGCLSFELSHGVNRLVINCGVPAPNHADWRYVARTTAAHSTLTINDKSSCLFLTGRRVRQGLGVPILFGPDNVVIKREETNEGTAISARHNGYEERFGFLHERVLSLAVDGNQLDGIDRITQPGPAAGRGRNRYAIRFHLHPSVKASQMRGGGSVLLACPSGEAWEFWAEQCDLGIEESIYFSDIRGHRRSHQIVIHSRPRAQPEIRWSFVRVEARAASQYADASADQELLF
jgi:uncharacterized heparinase superfamily protein